MGRVIDTGQWTYKSEDIFSDLYILPWDLCYPSRDAPDSKKACSSDIWADLHSISTLERSSPRNDTDYVENQMPMYDQPVRRNIDCITQAN